MTPSEADTVLCGYESNLYADLYKSRWDTEYASSVVPNLIQCLRVDDSLILLRTLSALNRIGPEARAAGDSICPLLHHADAKVQVAAIYALTGVWFREGHRAIEPLTQITNEPFLLKDMMFGLIRLGAAAKPTKHIFVGAFDHSDGRIRRLALRGLREICADGPDVDELLRKAVNDKSSQVRKEAVKLKELISNKESPNI